MHHCSSLKHANPTRCTTTFAIPPIIPNTRPATSRCQSPVKIEYSASNSTPLQQSASGCHLRQSFPAYSQSLIISYSCIQRKTEQRHTSSMQTLRFTSQTPSPLSHPTCRRVPSVTLPAPVHIHPLERARRRQQHTSCTTHTTRYSSRHTRHTSRCRTPSFISGSVPCAQSGSRVPGGGGVWKVLL